MFGCASILARSQAIARPTTSYHATVSTWVEIGDRVFVRRYEFYDQNIGVVLGDAAVLVIDTRSTHVQAREVAADLRMLTSYPVTVVVDTHGHFDHAFGNHVFRPATIWGHAGCPPFLIRTAEARRARVARDEPSLATDLAEVLIDPPDQVFETTATIDVGGRRVELCFLGRGHTDHDAVVSIPDADVVFAGDLIEGGNVPFFNDAYPLDWPGAADALAALVTGIVVPGHGDHAGHAFAVEQATAIGAVADLARRVDAEDLGLEDAIALTPFPAFPPEDIRAPLKRALAQLRGELS
jgi:glyoxylase-like metal-dependent hydrolase (beta-lactamase superfamily II)